MDKVTRLEWEIESLRPYAEAVATSGDLAEELERWAQRYREAVQELASLRR